jgi:nitrate reductase gamma subunit
MFDVFLYGALPYLAFALAIGGGLYRYYRDRFSYSSFSSQLLEKPLLFWGSVPLHYGIVILLIGHLIGLLIPQWIADFNGVPLRLYILEITAFGLGLFALVGLVVLIVRRITSPYVAAVTTRMDAILLFLLLVQVVAGLYTAVFQRWGSWWYISNAVPYLISLATLSPQIDYARTLPFMTQLHTVNAFLLVAIFPFTRLVHIFTLPITYLWRPYQTVVWNRRQKQMEELP